MSNLVPDLRYNTPTLDHDKLAPYIDYPVVYNEVVTERPFYVDGEFLWVCSDAAAKLLKWNGNSYTEISSYTNPDIISGRGFFAITTTVPAYATVSELRPLDNLL